MKRKRSDERKGAKRQSSSEARTEFLLSVEREGITLSNRDRDRLLELLDNPPAPTEALRRAVRHYRETVVLSE